MMLQSVLVELYTAAFSLFADLTNEKRVNRTVTANPLAVQYLTYSPNLVSSLPYACSLCDACVMNGSSNTRHTRWRTEGGIPPLIRGEERGGAGETMREWKGREWKKREQNRREEGMDKRGGTVRMEKEQQSTDAE